MNEWERKSADDACCKSYSYDYPANLNKLKTNEYMIKFEYGNYLQKKSKWQLLKDKTALTLKEFFIFAPVQLAHSIKYIFVGKKQNELEIASLRYELEACKIDRDHYKQGNDLLRMINDNLTKTLSAWITMDNETFKEQMEQKKKAAKKRPSSKKKRKG